MAHTGRYQGSRCQGHGVKVAAPWLPWEPLPAGSYVRAGYPGRRNGAALHPGPAILVVPSASLEVSECGVLHRGCTLTLQGRVLA